MFDILFIHLIFKDNRELANEKQYVYIHRLVFA